MPFWQDEERFLKWGACLSFNHQAARVRDGETHQPKVLSLFEVKHPRAAAKMTWTLAGNQV